MNDDDSPICVKCLKIIAEGDDEIIEEGLVCTACFVKLKKAEEN